MCHFLTLSVPGPGIPDVPDQFRDGIYFSVQNNESINRLIPTGWMSFTATSGACSCDLYRDPKDSSDNHDQLLKRYRKKGWSEAKIQRALESRTQSASHTRGLRADVLELVEELVKSHGEVRLSLHWYGGDIGTESFLLQDGGKVFLEDLKNDASLFPVETMIHLKESKPT